MAVNRIQSYTFSNKDRIIFDTNIWFFIHGPQSIDDQRQKIYSKAFHEIISNESKLYIDVLIMAEFVNRVARFYYDLWCEENNLSVDFKQFRTMEDCKQIVTEIEIAAQMILIDAKPIETGFSSMDISTVLTSFKECKHDFNDLIIIDLCRRNGLILVTDDSDFINADIDILTSNKKLYE